MEKLWECLTKKDGRRQALIQLREQLRKDGAAAHAKLRKLHSKDTEVLGRLLLDEDAKTRKNAALVIGEIADQTMMDLLWKAYCLEQTRFVKSAYLQAFKNFEYTLMLPELKKALSDLEKQPINDENRKHFMEEKRLLRELIMEKEPEKPHVYKGEGILSEIVLTTNRNYKHVVMELLGSAKKKEFNAGVMLQTKYPAKLFEIRCFEELFFLLPKGKRVGDDPAAAAKELILAGIVPYVEARHEKGKNPFLFRIEVRGTMTLEKRSVFVRKMAAVLEEESGGKLANAVSGYEVEIRLVEGSAGGYNVLLKLFTLRDFRFSYRRKTVSAGMRPANAALAMALAAKEDFFKEKARVLDPFCGAGTMLIERAKAGKTGEVFGLDILSEAIDAARENTELADCKVNYIQRDFFTFTMEQHFDEIVTDMPFSISEQEEKKQAISQLYRGFFEKIPVHLADDGRMLLYTHDRALVRQYAKSSLWVIKEFELSMKEKSYLMLLWRR